jgi:hypothetical protein
VPVIQCQSPDRYRWGKAGRDYRGLRKTWITDDLTRKSHTQIKPALVVKTPIADLGLGMAPVAVKAEGVSGSSGAGSPDKPKSGCSIGLAQRSDRSGVLLTGLLLLLAVARRARRD